MMSCHVTSNEAGFNGRLPSSMGVIPPHPSIFRTHRRLGTKLVFESLQGSAGGLLGGRRKGAGRGKEGGGDNGSLHGDKWIILVVESCCALKLKVNCALRVNRAPEKKIRVKR